MPRRPKKPTPKDLQEIEMLAGMGLNQQQIADVKGMHRDTLRKYAKDLLNKGKAKAIARVAQTAFEMATSGNNTAMTIFYLKTQAQWREHAPSQEELFTIFGLNHEDDDDA